MKLYVRLIPILFSVVMGCSLYMELDPIEGELPDMSAADLEDMELDAVSGPDMPEVDLGQDANLDSDSDSDADADMNGPAPSWEQVVAGRSHTCALNTAGEAWCWGSGRSGELGSGEVDSVTPLKVPLEVPLAALALGAQFSCGASPAGELYCWGTLPGRAPNLAPFLFDGASWENVKANSFHACGLREGALHCFGSNSHGQLGSGTPGPSALVAQPAELIGTLVDFAVSEHQTCALLDAPNRQLWCAGAQLGSTLTSSAGRREIPTTEAYTAIFGSQDHYCVLTEQGEPHCFGPADHLFALRASGSLMEPGPFAQVQEFDSIVLGRSAGCGFNTEGTVLCWGGNRRGKLGRGTEQTSDEMAQNFGPLDFAGNFKSLTMGNQHACGVTDEHEIRCWGEHFPSATGIAPGYSHIPQKVISEEVFEEVAVGVFTTCGITDDGRVSCWGRNYPSLGLNATTHIESPTVLGGLTATSLLGGGDFYCANTTENLRCWGSNSYGRLGHNSSLSSSVPVNLFIAGSFQHVALGNTGGCGIQIQNGETLQYCWGRRQLLGFAATLDSRVPILLDGAHKEYVQFAVGETHACGLDQNGQVYCWGENTYGQLGNNSTSFSAGPVAVAGGLIFSEISVGDDVTCGLADQSVYCWGYGQATGGTSTASVRVPTPIAHSGAIYGVSGNEDTLCGVDENGDVYCWGSNGRGQAGATRSLRIGPPQKVALPGPAQMVRSGQTHSCALLMAGEIYCWGDASFYALGDGGFGMSLSPTPISTP